MNNESNIVLIHVGLPKCGSTTLQAGLFSQHPDLLLFRLDLNDPARAKIAEDIIFPIMKDEVHFNASHVLLAIEQMEEYSRVYNKIPVLSCEGLASTRYIGIRKKTERLASVFKSKEVKLLFVVREPLSLVRSTFYHNFIYAPPKKTTEVNINRWLNNLVIDYEANESETNFLNSLNYYDLWCQYRSHFGNNNVEITTLEKLGENEKVFYSEICSFYGIQDFYPSILKPSNVTAEKVIPEGLTFSDKLTRNTVSKLFAQFRSQFDKLEKETGVIIEREHID